MKAAAFIRVGMVKKEREEKEREGKPRQSQARQGNKEEYSKLAIYLWLLNFL